MSIRFLPALVAFLALFLAGCGGSGSKSSGGSTDGTTTNAPPSSGSTDCGEVPSALKTTLAASLKKGKTIGKAASAKSSDQFLFAPQELNRGAVYFVSADVKPSPGISTWAVSEDAFKGKKGGMILGVDAAARGVSSLGLDVDKDTLEGWDVTENANGYAASRACLGKS